MWIISAEDRAKHNAQFEQLKPVNGFVTGSNILVEGVVHIEYWYLNYLSVYYTCGLISVRYLLVTANKRKSFI